MTVEFRIWLDILAAGLAFAAGAHVCFCAGSNPRYQESGAEFDCNGDGGLRFEGETGSAGLKVIYAFVTEAQVLCRCMCRECAESESQCCDR